MLEYGAKSELHPATAGFGVLKISFSRRYLSKRNRQILAKRGCDFRKGNTPEASYL